MKATFEVELKERKTLEFELPYFVRYEIIFYKVVDKKRVIQVDAGDYTEPLIALRTPGQTFAFSPDAIPCTKEEFDFAFQKALDKLMELRG